jgi:hypothetical protein
VVEAALLVVAGSQATGSALYSVTGNRVRGLIGVTALLVLEGDGKSNAALLLETVFFLRRAAAAKHTVYPNIC